MRSISNRKPLRVPAALAVIALAGCTSKDPPPPDAKVAADARRPDAGPPDAPVV